MTDAPALASTKLNQVIREGVSEAPLDARANPLWARMRELGTELWLDTGDMDQAATLWSAEFTALTTNNTLLNMEIQKGIYDQWIPLAAAAVREDQPDIEGQDLVLEIAFALNARHGLRLHERFGAYVSVELHTDLAHDVERSVAYGRRYASLCDHFIVKVPLTPSGLIAARRLEDEGIPVNFTLGFSARQNHLVARFARPSWVNVFMGRLNAYAAAEGLGDGAWVGERATLASQATLVELREKGLCSTRQIGASMRSAEQVATLAGLDVFTVPCGVTAGFLADPPAVETLADRTGEDYRPTWAEGVDPVAEGLEELWEVDPGFQSACDRLAELDPATVTAQQIVDLLHDAGQGNLFPRLSEAELAAIADEGKLPKRARWSGDLASGRCGLDALFTLAGLLAFTKDQAALDDRIRGL